VLGHCASITDGESLAPEGLADFVGALAAGVEGAFKALDSFGPVGPLGMFAHHVMEVRDSRVEGRRLRLWAETLIPDEHKRCTRSRGCSKASGGA